MSRKEEAMIVEHVTPRPNGEVPTVEWFHIPGTVTIRGVEVDPKIHRATGYMVYDERVELSEEQIRKVIEAMKRRWISHAA